MIRSGGAALASALLLLAPGCRVFDAALLDGAADGSSVDAG